MSIDQNVNVWQALTVAFHAGNDGNVSEARQLILQIERQVTALADLEPDVPDPPTSGIWGFRVPNATVPDIFTPDAYGFTR
ncbi:MAG: hypothetical protein ACKVOJ_09830 [Sphingomonadaceae bacterium]